MNDIQPFQTSQIPLNDFELFGDFISDASFQQFIEQIANDSFDSYTPIHHETLHEDLLFGGGGGGYGSDDVGDSGSGGGEPFLSTSLGLEEVFGLNNISTTSYDPNYIAYTPPFGVNYMEEVEEANVGDYSSGTTTTGTTPISSNGRVLVDNSRSMITSERRRRVRMKEKLYALRALVPNITKMDKASIVGDAVSYVKELQMQAKKLRTEIEELESASIKEKSLDQNYGKKSQTQDCYKHQLDKKILQMDVVDLEESMFCVRLVCSIGEGVAVALYRALESLTAFNIQSSNFATFPERLVFTFILNVKEGDWEDMSLSNLRLWVNRALLNQGFEYMSNNMTNLGF